MIVKMVVMCVEGRMIQISTSVRKWGQHFINNGSLGSMNITYHNHVRLKPLES